MKITPNHISLMLSREGSSVLVLAERKNAEQWTLQKQNEDRKDTFTEAVLQQAIDKGDMTVKSFALKPQTVSLDFNIDTSDAVGQLAELEEQLEKTAIAGRALLVVLGALDGNFAMCDVRLKANDQLEAGDAALANDIIQQEAANRATGDAALAARIDALESATANLKTYNAEGLNVVLEIKEPISDGTDTSKGWRLPYTADDFRFAKTVDIDGKAWSRDTIGGTFWAGDSSASIRAIAHMVNNAIAVQTTHFPALEIYNYLSAKYVKANDDANELSQAVSKLEAELVAVRARYNAACDTRELLYRDVLKVHGQL